MTELRATRRRIVLAPLLAALPFGLVAGRAEAINPSETQVVLPDQIKWTEGAAGPPHSAEIATLYGGLDEPGEYVVLMKWHPGYLSAPHSYAIDRLCLVLSGTWWVNSGRDFDPDATVPVPPGGFVRRVARVREPLRRIGVAHLLGRRRGQVQELTRRLKRFGAIAVGEQAAVTDAVEAFWGGRG